jgi:hypothetical protein
MISEPMVNRNGHVSYGQDENCFARFHKHPYKGGMHDFIEIIFPGARDTTDRPVKESDKQRFGRQWEAYEKGEEFKAEGYPLENWQAMDQGMVREYNHKRVYTVEQFANMAESNLDNLGLGARTLHTKAKAFLAAHKDTKVAEKYAAQNEELKKQMTVLIKSNKDMKDRLDSLEVKKKGKK